MKNENKFNMNSKIILAVSIIILSIPKLCFGWSWSENIVGNGKIISKSYSFVDQKFNVVDFGGAGNVTVNIDDSLKHADATMTVDSNLLPYIEIYVKDKALHIKDKEGVRISSWNKREITINTHSLKSFVSRGSSDNVINVISGNISDVELQGSGSIGVYGNTENLGIKTYGSVKTNLRGQTNKLNLMVSGSGEINTKELNAEDVKISIFGSSNAIVRARKTISVNINGTGSIKYYGDPAIVKQNVAGSGKIVRLGS